ncbi:MAG: threonine--tRNA ligase [Candidatus Woesearchaeota archaeon]
MIKITLPDGSTKNYPSKTTGYDVALSIAEGLARNALAVEINGEIVDLNSNIPNNSEVRIITFRDDEGVEIFRHSTAHLMAQAILRLYPEAKLAIGPVIENGFYYDIGHAPFKEEDLLKIEAEMKKIVKENIEIKRKEVSTKKALELFKDNKYKVEIIKNIEEFGEGKTSKSDTVSIYEQGEFFDLCRGPHVPRTGMLKAFKLTKISGAYWRADSNNDQLQRIYGISFPDKKQLKEYLHKIEEASKRDHRKLMKQLDLVMLHETSPGSPFFLEKGAIIYNELVDFIRSEYKKRGYKEVITPQMFNKKLWEMSGHWEHYKENMFVLNSEGQEFSLKPMNCPSHCLIFNNSTHSYKDLPLRIADFCALHRNELSGTLSGLTRVRKFSQDDAHIFCTLDQVQQEVEGVIDFIKYVWEEIFGFNLTYYVSTRPEKYLGDPNTWDDAERMLFTALEKNNIPYSVKEGDGAFYGPKIDIDLEDALGRKWQCPTCQLDFNLPERFSLTYEGSDSKKHRPVMIHRAILGSIERFFGIMIEHYAGKFPLWISPVQVKVLTLADRHNDYATQVINYFKEHDIRVEPDFRSETISKKVRDAQLEQVNYILVVGDKEVKDATVTIRTRDGNVVGSKKYELVSKELVEEIKLKK